MLMKSVMNDLHVLIMLGRVASLRICCGQPKYAKVLFPRPPSDAFRLLKRPEAFVFGNIRKWIGYK